MHQFSIIPREQSYRTIEYKDLKSLHFNIDGEHIDQNMCQLSLQRGYLINNSETHNKIPAIYHTQKKCIIENLKKLIRIKGNR